MNHVNEHFTYSEYYVQSNYTKKEFQMNPFVKSALKMILTQALAQVEAANPQLKNAIDAVIVIIEGL